jgi:hypothetical protein
MRIEEKRRTDRLCILILCDDLAYVYGTVEDTEPECLTFKEPRNRFQGINSAILCSLEGRYDNPIPTRFLAPKDCLKIPAQRERDPLSHI